MKIVTSPFESADDSALMDAIDRARVDEVKAAAEVPAPAATTEIQPGLNAATRDSLSRLALLMKSQSKPANAEADSAATAVEEVSGQTEESVALAEAETPGQQRESHDESGPRDESANETIREEGLTKLHVHEAPRYVELPPIQVLSADTFPALVKLERCFEQIARERGSKIYQQQKTKDAVHSILSELERRHYDALGNMELESADELLGGLDDEELGLTLRRAVA